MSYPDSAIEKVLIARYKTGDTSAYSCIFLTYYKDLVSFAVKITKNIDDAEEIVQDTFVKLWEIRGSVCITISLRSYLLKMVYNRCLDWSRHMRSVREYKNLMLETSQIFDFNTESCIEFTALQEQIEKELDEMPAEISEPFRMNRYKGLKYNEIAKLLGVSVRTIEVRIGKALSILRHRLLDYLPLIVCVMLYRSIILF